ncbi:glycoside hydrolase family 27 protein [Gracilimonas mengyeensis]|uniref:Alpha-galactosidase n=1 Tax=Gracilimonas mengyeensis TaxID=1302730 RepID=A0A521BKA3_9BACT|nr:glycoside hydrolase family 27 protein [Gracilimonas mengyeensis]SMO47574.1 alpha-galactosidase [Gracilimonas mengyeensis]
MKKIAFIVLGLFVFASTSTMAQKFDGLAETPPMGWNSWNEFGCNVDEDLIKETADAMVESGMKEAGYEYVNIDDCWHGERDEDGNITVDKEKFPSGMKALADYVHSKGLKLGIYSDAGYTTCAGYPGSRGYEYQDAQTYAEWGIDYLKYDWCDTEGLAAEGAYMTMRDALAAAGNPVVFSICEWGTAHPWEWADDVGHAWRISGDIYPCFDCEYKHEGGWSSWGVTKIIDMRKDQEIRQYSGPGHWNDYDMMEVGNGMKAGEDRAHFAMWAMLNSPLIAGNDIRDMSDQTRKILTNEEVIAVNQDPEGVEAWRYTVMDSTGVWVKPLADGDIAVAFLNRSQEDHEINFTWTNHVFGDPHFDYSFDFTETEYLVRDLWSGKNIGSTQKSTRFTVPGHDLNIYRLIKQ